MKHYDNWSQTYRGNKFYLFHPEPDSIEIEDIAHSLSMQCRYNGHTKTFYSVAEHSWWVSYLVSPENALLGLMHDSAEAYISDIPKPFKDTLGHYIDVVETNILEAISDKFGFDSYFPTEIKVADIEMLVYEKEQMLLPAPHAWGIDGLVPSLAPQAGLDVVLEGWSPEEAKAKFLDRFHELLK